MIRVLASILVAATVGGCSYANLRSEPDAPLANALWNESGPNRQLGFWLYPRSGGCPDLREGQELPLVFGTVANPTELRQTLDVADLSYCFQLPPRDRQQDMAKCISGHVQLTFVVATNRYSGRYTFALSDGTAREGEFEAVFCPKRGDA